MKKTVGILLLAMLMVLCALPAAALAEEAAQPDNWQTGSPGWLELEDGNWRYYDAKGNAIVSSWAKVGGNWFAFDSQGLMRTGWYQSGSKRYYLKDNGKMATNWYKVEGKWYYFGTSGVMVEGGYRKIGKAWHEFKANGVWVAERKNTGWERYVQGWCFRADGSWVQGWQQIEGDWYFLDGNDYLVIGWHKIGNSHYYFKPSGKMATGWLKDGDKWYYLKDSGKMAAGETLTIKGKSYTFRTDGTWVE